LTFTFFSFSVKAGELTGNKDLISIVWTPLPLGTTRLQVVPPLCSSPRGVLVSYSSKDGFVHPNAIIFGKNGAVPL
jgi:hypothetical protein